MKGEYTINGAKVSGYTPGEVKDTMECQLKCRLNSGCHTWIVSTNGMTCYLLYTDVDMRAASNHILGHARCGEEGKG